MIVRELIEELQKHDPELEVKIHPEEELFLDVGMTAFGDIGRIEESKLYLENSENLYKEREDFLEDKIDSGYSLSEIKKSFRESEKLHALFIKAIV